MAKNVFNLQKFGDKMLKLDERLEWDEYHMATAILMASRSICHRLHVGCVIIQNQRLISAGYNGFLPKAPHKSCMRYGHEQATVHAEQNAIANAASLGTSVLGATAYVTHFPCVMCAKILAASGIKKILYMKDYGSDKDLVEEILIGGNVLLKKLDME